MYEKLHHMPVWVWWPILALGSIGLLTTIAVWTSHGNSPDSNLDSNPAPETTSTGYTGLPRLIVWMIDDTGSYVYYWASQQKLIQIAGNMGPDDRLYVVLITDWANEVKDIVLMPDFQRIEAIQKQVQILRNVEAEKWWLRKRLRKEPQQRLGQLLDDYRQDQIKQVEALKFRGIWNTDVYGAFYLATEVFQGDSERRKFLVISSDLGDTVGRTDLTSQINLRNVNVQCIYFPTKLVETENRQYRLEPDSWIEKMYGWGAASVMLMHRPQSDTAQLCIPEQQTGEQ